MVKERKSEKVVLDKNRVLTNFFDDIEVGESISYKALQLFPVYKGTTMRFNLKTLAEAIESGIVEIKETGVVKEIEIINKSNDTKILIMEGDIVKGGAQNRIINTSMILDENSKVKVPCSCVQQHRWSGFDKPFKEYKHSSPKFGYELNESVNKQMLSSRGSSCYMADQSEIWNNVNSVLLCVDSQDNSKDYTDAYEVQKDKIEEYKKAFKEQLPIKDKNFAGLVIVVGSICKADICGDNEIFKVHLEGLLEGCYLDAVNTSKTDKMELKEVTNFLNDIPRLDIEEFDTPNKNAKNLIFKKGNIEGNALINKGDELVHINAFLDRSEPIGNPDRK